jgi:hypothetical protein
MKCYLIFSLLFSFLIKASDCKSQKIIKDRKSKIISPALYKEILLFDRYADSLAIYGNYSYTPIVFVEFELKDQECNVLIGKQNVYNRSMMNGYLKIGKKLLVFYSSTNSCNCGLVNNNKLHTKLNKNHLNENSIEARYNKYDPWGRKFKIHNRDSLEFISQGFF